MLSTGCAGIVSPFMRVSQLCVCALLIAGLDASMPFQLGACQERGIFLPPDPGGKKNLQRGLCGSPDACDQIHSYWNLWCKKLRTDLRSGSCGEL
jgi:hypothetical protein